MHIYIHIPTLTTELTFLTLISFMPNYYCCPLELHDFSANTKHLVGCRIGTCVHIDMCISVCLCM